MTERYTPEQLLAKANLQWSNQETAAMLRQAASDAARIAELEKDVDRYRFAKEHTKAFENYFGCEYREIDQAIDAARSRT